MRAPEEVISSQTITLTLSCLSKKVVSCLRRGNITAHRDLDEAECAAFDGRRSLEDVATFIRKRSAVPPSVAFMGGE